MNQLETLLNSLIKMGWKPADFQGKSEIKISEDGDVVLYMNAEDVTLAIKVKLRNLVSLESGLWQFCEKNGLLREYYNGRSSIHPYKCYWTTTYEYRLIESSLVPEEELAQFLVDNIKVEGLESEPSKK